jgi:hypothetical protein
MSAMGGKLTFAFGLLPSAITDKSYLRGTMRLLLIITVACGFIAPQATATARNEPASFRGYDLSGQPWGLTSEMSCAEAREHLLQHGMKPFNFGSGIERAKMQMPQGDAPHAAIFTPGDYKRFPNVLGCSERATRWCDYAYRRKADGRLFVLQTEGHDEADCVVNRMFFASRRGAPSPLSPRDIYGDWKHPVSLPIGKP